MSRQKAEAVRIVAVFATSDDRKSLHELSRSLRWKVQFVENCRDLAAAFEEFQPHVVLTQSALGGGESWKDVLETTHNRFGGPPVIVSSRLADDRLWVEVLNLGGYDLLMSPFDATEIQNVVCMACRAHRNQMERRQTSAVARAS